MHLRKNPLLAFLLSAVLIGWGLFYAGRPRRAWSVVGLTYGPVFLAGLLGWLATPIGIQLLIGFMLLMYLVSALMAVWASFRTSGVEDFPGWRTLLVYGAGLSLFIFAIAGPMRGSVLGYELYQNPSRAMEPAISPGDYLVADGRFDARTAKVGDVVVYRLKGTKVVSSVAAVAGDTLSIVNGEVINNGRNFGLFYAQPQNVTRTESLEMAAQTIAPGHVFVLGDNRDISNDSRFNGQVPVTEVSDRIMGIWYSKDETRIGTVFDFGE